MRLVLLALLDGGLVAVEVLVGGETLDALLHEVAVRHRVADDHDLQPLRIEQGGEVARGLALAGAGARGAGGNDGLRAPDHGRDGTEEHEVRRRPPAPGWPGASRTRGPRRCRRRRPGRSSGARRSSRAPSPGRCRSRPGRAARPAPADSDGDRSRDLGGREGDHLDAGVVAVDDVEVVEVAPRGAHDHDLRAVQGRPLLRISADADEPVPDPGPAVVLTDGVWRPRCAAR